MNIFLDQIQLLPEFSEHWAAAMRAIVDEVGPGRYLYGSEWSSESRRDTDINALLGVSVTGVRLVYLESIDFAGWPNWEAYWKDVSQNIRRNYRKINADNEQSLEPKSTFKFLPSMINLRRRTLSGKYLAREVLNLNLGFALRTIMLRGRIKSIILTKNKSLTGFANSIYVGRNVFYMEGGSRRDVPGVGWYTLMTAIKTAFERTNGRGNFIMGPVDDETLATSQWKGMARSRTACRASRHSRSIIEFHYDA